MKKIARAINVLNEMIAMKTTLAMSTMWCVYLFFVWSVLPVLAESTKDFVFYVSGGVIQLVALPLIMVGQSVLNRASEERASQDHEALMAQLEIMKQLLSAKDREMELLQEIQKDVDPARGNVGEEKIGLDGVDPFQN